VFLLRHTNSADAVEKWYYILVLMGVAGLIGSGVAITLSAPNHLDLQRALCSLDIADSLPYPRLLAWLIVVQVVLIAIALYIVTIVSLVTTVISLAFTDLKRIQYSRDANAMAPMASRKLTGFMLASEMVDAKKPRDGWFSKLSDISAHMEDDLSLRKIRHIAVYPTWFAITLALPLLFQTFLRNFDTGLSVSEVFYDFLSVLLGLVGVGFLFGWCLDPTFWSALADERDWIAKSYVEEELAATRNKQSMSAGTFLRRVWERVVWLRETDILRFKSASQAEAMAKAIGKGGDPVEPDRFASTNDSGKEAAATPVVVSRTVAPPLSKLRRGSTTAIRERKASTTPIGMRKPSVTPAMTMTDRVAFSTVPIIPSVITEEDEEEDEFESRSRALTMPVRRPSSRPPLPSATFPISQFARGQVTPPSTARHRRPSASNLLPVEIDLTEPSDQPLDSEHLFLDPLTVGTSALHPNSMLGVEEMGQYKRVRRPSEAL